MSGDTFTKDLFEWLEAQAADQRLQSSAIRIAFFIATLDRGKCGGAGPSISSIAAAASVSQRTVGRAISALCRAGYLDKCRAGFGRPNSYCLSFPRERLHG